MNATRGAIGALGAALALGAVLYHAKGLTLLATPEGGVDVHLRWQEQRYVMQGQNPYDVTYAALGVGRPPSDPERNAVAIPEIGIPDSGGYPPWAFLIGYLMFWPSWPETKSYFLALSLAMTATAAAWAYRTVRPFGRGREAGWLGATSVLAISGFSTCIHVGQYGAVVVGLLALSAWALSRGRDTLAGVLIGVALLKPTIAGPFVLILLVTGRWRALAACVGYVALACAFVWWRTSTNPAEMFFQSISVAEGFVQDSQGLVNVLISFGLKPGQVTPVLAVAVGIPGLLGLYAIRRRSIPELYAAAAVIGRLWAYHKSYDNMMLAFLLTALAALVLERRTAWAWAGFLLAGAVTWAPASLARGDGFLFVQITGWLIGLAVLFRHLKPPETQGSLAS